MKHLILTIFLIPLFSVLLAQESAESFDYLDEYYDSTVYKRESPTKPLRKMHVGVDVGMAYSFSSAGYGGPMFTLSPHATYPLTDRFSLSAGISVGHGSFYNPYLAEQGGDLMLPMTRMFIYASGNYMLSERLSVNGTIYKQVLDVPNRNPGQTYTNLDSHGGAIGFQYKITPNISFGAQIRVEEPGFYNPYNSFGNGNRGMQGSNWW